MKQFFALSSRWHLCGWILFGAVGFGAGWLLKPVEPIRGGSAGKVPVREETAPGSATSSAPNSTQLSVLTDQQSIGAKARFLPKDGSSPVSLADRLRFTFADSRGAMQEMAFSRILSEMTATDAPAILAMLDEVEAGGDRGVEAQRKALLLQWGELDPAGALASMKKDAGRRGSRALESACDIMQGWAAKDMTGALAALNDETDDSVRGRLLHGLVITYAGQELSKCTEWALTQDRADLRECGIALGWVAACTFGIETGIPWYRDLPNDGPGGIKEGAWRGVSQTAQKVGGKALVDLMASSADLPWCRPEQVAGGLRAATSEGLTAGLDFLAALPPAGLQKVADRLDAVFHESSFAEAGTWLKSKQTSPAYDFLACEFANRLRSHDPDAAGAWAATIRDPTLRTKAGGTPQHLTFRRPRKWTDLLKPRIKIRWGEAAPEP